MLYRECVEDSIQMNQSNHNQSFESQSDHINESGGITDRNKLCAADATYNITVCQLLSNDYDQALISLQILEKQQPTPAVQEFKQQVQDFVKGKTIKKFAKFYDP